MSQAFTPGLQVKRYTSVRRVRELPLLGEVLAQKDAVVDAEQVVARAELPGDLTILRIGEDLSIHPSEVVKGLQIAEGVVVGEGDVVCIHAGLFGLFKSVYRSPVSGTIELINPRTGHVGVRGASKKLEVTGYISGKVVSVIEKRGVEIESEGTFIQGIFGVGGERNGTIKNLSATEDELITPEKIPADCNGCILVGGMRPTIEALRTASERGAVALICGSIDDAVLSEYLGYELGIALTGDENIPMTVIITEGFGALPISSRITELLKLCEGRRASVNGATQVRAGAERPEIIVPDVLDGAAESCRGAEKGLQVGSHIRLIRYPYFGRFATVTELPHETQEIETGAQVRVLRARLEDGSVITVPRANVELA